MPAPSRQQGASLLIAMIFLIFMSIFALSAYKGSIGNLRIVGNMQAEQESVAVAQMAIEKTISNSLFVTKPIEVAATPVAVDIDGNGSIDYSARLNPQPKCYSTKPIKSSELNQALATDRVCMTSSVVQQSGIIIAGSGVMAGDSLCANSAWNIGAVVEDVRTGTKVSVNQGIGVRVLQTDAASFCL